MRVILGALDDTPWASIPEQYRAALMPLRAIICFLMWTLCDAWNFWPGTGPGDQ